MKIATNEEIHEENLVVVFDRVALSRQRRLVLKSTRGGRPKAARPASGSLDGSDVVYVAPQRMRVGTVAGRLLFSAAVSELAAGELVSSTSGLTKTPVGRKLWGSLGPGDG